MQVDNIAKLNKAIQEIENLDVPKDGGLQADLQNDGGLQVDKEKVTVKYGLWLVYFPVWVV